MISMEGLRLTEVDVFSARILVSLVPPHTERRNAEGKQRPDADGEMTSNVEYRAKHRSPVSYCELFSRADSSVLPGYGAVS
jgi:hypothetical protein